MPLALLFPSLRILISFLLPFLFEILSFSFFCFFLFFLDSFKRCHSLKAFSYLPTLYVP